MDFNDGFIILNKIEGCTSHDCIKIIRNHLNIKKAGHTGTLDPEVTGVLPIALGNATRFIQYLPQSKTYIGKIQLGLKTTTDDIYGDIIYQNDIPKLDSSEIETHLDSFRGTFLQIPPKVSSVHVKGERAYKKFRRNENFELPPKEVSVENLILKNYDQALGQITIEISCSSGTYIRSIARDLGKTIKSEGCLAALIRTKASGFKLENSITIDNLKKEGNINKIIIPISSALDHLPKIILENAEENLFWQTGRRIVIDERKLISNNSISSKKVILVFNNQNVLLGLGNIVNIENNFLLQPKIVLNAK
tara:strand:- start:2240 stop:3160 length:921 start_codon:yes stop_codon:yes gene_type:complete